jgi:hypothetical protein
MKAYTLLFAACMGACASSFSSVALEQINFEELSSDLLKDSQNTIQKDMATALERASENQRDELDKQAKKIIKERIDSLTERSNQTTPHTITVAPPGHHK